MKFYRYKVQVVKLADVDGDQLQKDMNKLGADTWENYAACPAPGGNMVLLWRQELSQAPGVHNVKVETRSPKPPHIP